MDSELYTPFQKEVADMVNIGGHELAKNHEFDDLINVDSGESLLVVEMAADSLGERIVDLVPMRVIRSRGLRQHQLEIMTSDYRIDDKKHTAKVIGKVQGWEEPVSQMNNVISRLGRRSTRFAISVINGNREIRREH